MTPCPPGPRPTASLGRGTLVLRFLAPLLLACTWLALPPDARADGCEGCPAPTLEDLKQVEGFRLEVRDGPFDTRVRDYYVLDRGECEGSLDGTPVVSIEDAWLALRATGEVWNCPHSSSADTITVESAASDRTDWTFSAKLSAGLEALGASFKTEVQAGRTTGTIVTEVTRISKTISPNLCHRILWRAFFEVASVKAVGAYRFRQRWAWWTKSALLDSSHVIAKGDIYMDCGSGELEMTRRAPIAGHFELEQRGCYDEECAYVVPKHLGMFPPWSPPEEPEDGSGDAPKTESPIVEGDEPEPLEDDPLSGPQSSEELGDAPTGALPDPLEPAP